MASRYRGRDGRPIQSRADRGQFSSGNSVAVPAQTGWAAMFGGGGRNVNDDDDNFNAAAGAEEVMMGQDVEEDRTDLLRIILYGAFYIATYYTVGRGRRVPATDIFYPVGVGAEK